MNAYKTPCSPMVCLYYCSGKECDKKPDCQSFANYQELKNIMKKDKEIRGQSFEQRAKGVDAIYKNERGNRHRVGQK